MKKTRFYLISATLIAFTAMVISTVSCNKQESVVTPRPPSNEFLTTVVFQCIDSVSPFDTTTGIWRQIDPTGVAAPDTLHAVLSYFNHTTYKCHIYELDETKTDTAHYVKPKTFNISNLPSTTVNVTDEIEARKNYHLECFTTTPASLNSNLTVVRTDYDNNNPPLQVGLADNVSLLNTATGRMEVVQHHQPNVKNGTCAPGSVDFDVFFTVTIK